jgi:chemotaxis protein MotB
MMRTVKLSGLFLLCICLAMASSGCVSEQLKSLEVQNAAQADEIDKLRSELRVKKIELDRLQRQLDDAQGLGGIKTTELIEQIKLLEDDIRRKDAMIASMQNQLMGTAALPVELSTLLEDFAKRYDLVTYDPARGIVKLKSDLLFEIGSDQVKSDAVQALTILSGILNTEHGKDFDVIVAGHTDDIPIGKPDTRAKHPTNWHLSAHRAISVLTMMGQSNMAPTRLSVRGFGEYRPVVPNKAGKGGNAQNRRVEIYIVPQGI